MQVSIVFDVSSDGAMQPDNPEPSDSPKPPKELVSALDLIAADISRHDLVVMDYGYHIESTLDLDEGAYPYVALWFAVTDNGVAHDFSEIYVDPDDEDVDSELTPELHKLMATVHGCVESHAIKANLDDVWFDPYFGRPPEFIL